jgi:hypothetical protein
MRKEKVICKATGAELDVSLGFYPDFVRILNATDKTELVWSGANLTGMLYGMTVAAAGDKAAAAAGYGVTLYEGAGVLGAADATIVVKKDDDVKGTVTTFTVGSTANKTGNVDVVLDTATVGVGSKIIMSDGKICTIVALTSNGEQANEITLDVLPTLTVNTVDRITSMYTHRGAVATDAPAKGIKIGASAVVNDTDGDVLVIEAELY